MKAPGEEVREVFPPRDGRDIDPELAQLTGEGALQRVVDPYAPPHGEYAWDKTPSQAFAEQSPTYYGVPTLKEPVWKWYVPAYFHVGGVSGACAALGAAADLLDRRRMASLSRRCRIVAASGAAVSGVLLIADLGRPERFLNMLRVVRPTSPMNIGSWILAKFGAFSGLAALTALMPVPRRVRRLGDGAAIFAGLLGLPLTGYTGVLLSNTAVPVWQGARRSLPVLFSSSGAAAAASLLDLFPPRGCGEDAAHRLGIVAKITELAMTFALEREVALAPRVALPLRTGVSGALWRGARALTAASLALSLLSRRRRRLRIAAGVLGTAGALALRFGVLQAGRRSARDPRATFEQQRAGRGASEVVRAEEPGEAMEARP